MQTVKIVVVGDSGVGKTSLIISYVRNEFTVDPFILSSCLDYSTTYTVGGKPINLSVWDTIGHEDYDNLRRAIYQQTDVFLLCFSLANPSSFENVRAKWLQEISDHSPNIPYILVGTKFDLRGSAETFQKPKQNEPQPISRKQGKAMTKQIKAYGYVECSALSQAGLKSVFDEAVCSVFLLPKSKKKTGCILL